MDSAPVAHQPVQRKKCLKGMNIARSKVKIQIQCMNVLNAAMFICILNALKTIIGQLIRLNLY